MIQVDVLMYVGEMVDEALMEETRRVSILQRVSTFIRKLVGPGQFARPLGAPSQPIVYTRRERYPLDMEFEVVQDEQGPSEPVVRRRTRHQDEDDLEHDEFEPS